MKKLIIKRGQIFIDLKSGKHWFYKGSAGPGKTMLIDVNDEPLICEILPEDFVPVLPVDCMNNDDLTIDASQLWDMVKLVHSLSPGNETDFDAYARIRDYFVFEAKKKFVNLLNET